MKPFLSEHFLLESETAQELYHEYAVSQPIIDYHCHLPPEEIATDKNFGNLTKIWMDGDHYKWRAMRTMGIDEKYITGDAPDKEKFKKWAETVPYTIRNPLYHWTHMELKNYFGITQLLELNSADEVYETCSELLRQPDYSVQSLINKMNVRVVCTTDDPVDSLDHHKKLRRSSFKVKVLPAFRPDKVYSFDNVKNYNKYVDTLADASNQDITTLANLLDALKNRIDYFHIQGCRLADHGIEKIYYADHTSASLEAAFEQVRSGKELDPDQKHALSYHILLELGRMYSAHGWVQQYLVGALRDTNDRMLRQLGPNTGFDSIGDFSQSRNLSRFLNQLDATNELAKTILYNVNPNDNEVMATMAGNYNDGSIKGKMQFGSAWWFMDQKDGMEKQLDALSNIGLLSCFVGMLTDSRSFLSYPRHEYFRRVLCNLIGRDVENGELPKDMPLLGKIVLDICYYNAKEYFNFEEAL